MDLSCAMNELIQGTVAVSISTFQLTLYFMELFFQDEIERFETK